jgi:hypothetical protein
VWGARGHAFNRRRVIEEVEQMDCIIDSSAYLKEFIVFTKDASHLMKLAIAEAAVTVYLWWSVTHLPFQLFPNDVSYKLVIGFALITCFAFRLSLRMEVETIWKAMESGKRKRKTKRTGDTSHLTLYKGETVADDIPEEIEGGTHPNDLYKHRR